MPISSLNPLDTPIEGSLRQCNPLDSLTGTCYSVPISYPTNHEVRPMNQVTYIIPVRTGTLSAEHKGCKSSIDMRLCVRYDLRDAMETVKTRQAHR